MEDQKVLRQSEMAKHQPHLLPIFRSTYGVIFLGCPHRGANAADWGAMLGRISAAALQSPNKHLLDSLKVDSEMLEVINSAFSVHLKDDKFKIHSFSEEKGILGVAGISGKVGCLTTQ